MCHRLLGPTMGSSAVSVKMRHKVWFRWFGYGMLLACKYLQITNCCGPCKHRKNRTVWVSILETSHVQCQWRIHGSLAWCAKCTFDRKSLTLMDPNRTSWLTRSRAYSACEPDKSSKQPAGWYWILGYDGILPQKGRPDGAQNPIVRLDSNFVHVWWLTQGSVKLQLCERSRNVRQSQIFLLFRSDDPIELFVMIQNLL